jgi:hypothetical protein
LSSDDDTAYHKSVRNMSVVLAAIVITIFAALFIPPYLFPTHNTYLSSVTLDSPVGFTLHLTLNSTSLSQGGAILLTGWVNSTSASIENITAVNSWALPQDSLLGRECTDGWPIGIGVMQGHYTEDNYTEGTLSQIPVPHVSCPVQVGTPDYFLLEPHSSKALVDLGATPGLWVIQSSLIFKEYTAGSQLHPGAYTAVVADEWGDVLTTNFQVT